MPIDDKKNLFTLWEIAKQISPHRWRAANTWIDIDDTMLSEAAQRSVELKIINRHPSLPEWQRTPIELRELRRKAELLRFRARFLIGTYLPRHTYIALMTGNYTVVGYRNGSGKLITLSDYNINDLEVDFVNNRLFNHNIYFDGICISPIRTKKGRKKGDGSIDDSKNLKNMKNLIDTGVVRSPNAAAKRIYPDNISMAERIGKKYKIWEKSGFPTI